MADASVKAIPTHSEKCENCEGEVATLEGRTYKTYLARLQACMRLNKRAKAWNALMISAALASLIASAAMLRDAEIYGPNGDLLWMFVAIITFTASLIVSSLNYSGRSRDMFLNYRKIQALSSELEFLKKHGSATHDNVLTLKRSYDALLDESENHTTADFFSTKDSTTRWQKLIIASSAVLDYAPWIAVILPVILILPPLGIVISGEVLP